MHTARLIGRFGRRPALQWAGYRIVANIERNRRRNRVSAFQTAYRREFIAGFEEHSSRLLAAVVKAGATELAPG